ncbi:thiolase C-terminal domain-containing protein [Acrocarpospora catenulata]|uniref:thiolase C-terminal domain-containing protein n=1 Tax=Acrocarpospora catenulata TaxID=2836182 RepID=UPI001BDAFB01|nr:acetyl-CoA acetyltransferase [Acrocarpospora catenulata]
MSDGGQAIAAVVGIGRTAYTRDPAGPRSPLSLAAEASRAAVADAGLDVADIDGVASYSMNDSATFGQVPYAIGAGELTWNLDVYAGGTGSFTSVHAAAMAVSSGVCRYALVYRSLCGRSGLRYSQGSGMASLLNHPDQVFDFASGYAVPPQWFAMWARRHQARYGTTPEDLGALAITLRAHAGRNPHAVMRDPLTLEAYLGSRMVSDPLRVYDCSLEVDGACALVVTTPERARDLAQPAVLIRGGEFTWNSGGSWNNWPDFTEMYTAKIADRFWNRFGLRPADVDVACVYDCFTYTLLVSLEGLGFYKPGEGGDYFRDGRAGYGGDVVVNPHGGLLSEGYIHGFNHHYEAVAQLRGQAGERQVDGASTAVVTAGGGPYGGALLLEAAR